MRAANGSGSPSTQAPGDVKGKHNAFLQGFGIAEGRGESFGIIKSL
jgi:hypothetical protein